jgi:hypothetical protein
MTDKNVHPEDQINLAGFKDVVRSSLKLFFRFCTFLQVVIEKGRFIMLGLGLVGGLLGAGYYYSYKKSYRASMVLTYNKLSKKTFAEILTQLDLLTGGNGYNKLASELNISINCANNIEAINAKNIFDLPLISDTSSKLNQPFKLDVSFKNTDSIEIIQNALLNYLNNRPYLKRIREEERKIYSEKLLAIELELQRLDSLKNEFTQFLSSTKVSSTFYNNAINPAEIYVQSNHLIDQKESIQRSLHIDENTVSLIDGFKPSALSRPLSLVQVLLISTTLGFIAGFILSFLIETRKKVDSYN